MDLCFCSISAILTLGQPIEEPISEEEAEAIMNVSLSFISDDQKDANLTIGECYLPEEVY